MKGNRIFHGDWVKQYPLIPVNTRNTRNSIPPDDLPPVDSPEEDAHTLEIYLQTSGPLDSTTLRERLNWNESRWIAAKNEAVAGGKVYCTSGLWVSEVQP